MHSYEEMVEAGTKEAVANEFAKSRDLVLIIAGVPFGQAGTTNNLRVVQIP